MAVTFQNLMNQLRYEDRQKKQKRTEERVESNQQFSKFMTIANDLVTASTGIRNNAENETDIIKINEALEKAESLKTGVDFVDNVIDANIGSVELRKRAVTARNEINTKLDSLQAEMGTGKTEGAKSALDSLESQYVMMADNMVQSNRAYLNDKFQDAREQYEYNLYKDEFDTDKEKEGYQLPSNFTELDKEYFNAELRTKMDISEKTGNYTGIIADLRNAFPEMRADNQAKDVADAKVAAAKLKADAIVKKDAKEEEDELQLAGNKRVLEGFKSKLNASKRTLSVLNNKNPRGPKKTTYGIAEGILPTDITMAGTDPSGFNPDALIDNIENSLLTLFDSSLAKEARDREDKGEYENAPMLDLSIDDVERQEKFDKIYQNAIENQYTNRLKDPKSERERKAVMDLYRLRADLLNYKKDGFPVVEDSAPNNNSMGGYQGE